MKCRGDVSGRKDFWGVPVFSCLRRGGRREEAGEREGPSVSGTGEVWENGLWGGFYPRCVCLPPSSPLQVTRPGLSSPLHIHRPFLLTHWVHITHSSSWAHLPSSLHGLLSIVLADHYTGCILLFIILQDLYGANSLQAHKGQTVQFIIQEESEGPDPQSLQSNRESQAIQMVKPVWGGWADGANGSTVVRWDWLL